MNVSDFPLYHYRAHVLSVHDGDTATFEVLLGLRVSRTLTIRTNGINAPELGTPAGPEARDHYAALMAGADALYLETDKERKSFDRWIARVYRANPDGSLLDIGQRMIDDGYAVAWP